MKRLSIAALLVTSIVLTAGCTGTRVDEVRPSATAPTGTVSTTQTPTHPKNLSQEGFDSSSPIEELAVGTTVFSVFEVYESATGNMVPIAQDQYGNLCVARGARTWSLPADQVGKLTNVSIAIKRTGEMTYQVIADEETAKIIQRDALGGAQTDLKCLADTSVEVLSDTKSRKVLNLVSDMRVSDTGYVLPTEVWVANPTSRTGRLLVNVTRRTPFAGSTLVIRRPDGLHVARSDKFDIVGSSQMEYEDEMDTFPRVTIDN